MNRRLLLALVLAAVPLLLLAAWLLRDGRPATAPPPARSPGSLAPAGLHFPRPRWPTTVLADARPAEHERFAPGSHDFWFENPHDRPVLAGLSRKLCNCSEVLLGLAPAGHPGPDTAPGAGVTWAPLPALDGDAGVLVPAHAAGWVRLGWKRGQAGPERIVAEVLPGPPADPAVPTRLEAWLLFTDPLYAWPGPEQAVEPIAPGDGSRQAAFTVYSTTRPAFTLRPDSEADQANFHPFVRVGTPVPLDEAACRELVRPGRSPARAAYRVPVTVLERLPDGRPNDMGPFHTPVRLTSDALAEPLMLTVTGSVRSEVNVVGGDERKDQIQLGTFPARFGVTRTATLEADAGVDLEVVRVPAFLKVESLTRAGEAGVGRQSWTLALRVEPNAVNGPFPREDAPELRDTAIYLATRTAPPRRIRIPVRGLAGQR